MTTQIRRHYVCRAGMVRRLKVGVDLQAYLADHPGAYKVCKPPSIAKLEEWQEDCGCKALDGCWVEPDGTCQHGKPSWLLALGLI